MASSKSGLKNASGIWHIGLDRAAGHASDTLLVSSRLECSPRPLHIHSNFSHSTMPSRAAKITKCLGKEAAAVRLLFIMADRIHEDLQVLFKMCFDVTPWSKSFLKT